MARSRQEKIIVHACGPEWAWVMLGRQGRVLERGRCEPGKANWPVDRPLTALMDAAHCIGLKLDLPEMSAARLDQALRWAAEEHLATSAEDEHVVAGPRDPSGSLCCIVVNGQQMRLEHEQLARPGLEVMLPDALCLPWQSGQLSLAELGGRILARWDDWSFGSFEPDLAPEILAAVAVEQDRLVWYGGDLPEWLAKLEPERAPAGQDGVLGLLATAALQPPINLLTGAFAPGSAGTARRQWRWAAGMAAGVVALVLLGVTVEHQMLQRQANALHEAIDAEFRRSFPGVTPAGRYRELAERELARLRFGQAVGLLELMNRTAPVISGQDGLQLDGLNYREGSLELSVRAPDVAALDQFEQRLRALDLDAALQSAVQDTDGATARIRVGARR